MALGISVVFSFVSSLSPPLAKRDQCRVLELNVLPGIGVACGDRRWEHVLPFRRRDARPDRIDEGMTEHWDEMVIFENGALDLFGNALAFSRLIQCQII